MSDLATIKQTARGRWPEIVPALTDIPAEALDGQHHPCPKCAGTDRFRALNDFRETGAVFCNQCFSQKNGDGIAAIQHYAGVDLKTAVNMIANRLGTFNGDRQAHMTNGRAKHGAKKPANLAALTKGMTKIDSAQHVALLEMFAKAKPPITAQGIGQCGGKLVRWRGHRCIRLDGRASIDSPTPTAVVLLRLDGQLFPAYGKLAERKTHSTGGSVNSWLASDDVTTAETILDVEGVTDLLAVADKLPPGWVAVTNTAGAKARGKLPRPWAKGKNLIVAGDADEPGVDGQQRAAAAYYAADARVELAELPYPIEKTHGKDLRDYLNDGHSIAELPTVEVAEEQATQLRDNSTDEEDPGIIKTLADEIQATSYFAQDAGGKLYRYVGGAFKPGAENHVKARVKHLLVDWGESKSWKSHLASEVVEFIRVDSPLLPDRPGTELVNVLNGMVVIETGKLLPHSPDYFSTVQLPVCYDPGATCPDIEEFIATTFPIDAHDLAWEIVGVLMTPETWLQKAILLLGGGGNGKSTWLALIVHFLGRCNVSTMPLHRLEADKFSVARLIGKLANVCADLPSEHLTGTSTFKALTGEDPLPAEYKFKDSFDLEPFARLVFSANHPPRSADSSSAFFRRWVVIPFDKRFDDSGEKIPRKILDARLQAPGELSGMLNKALEGLRRVRQQERFTEPESVLAAWRDFHATTDPLAIWLDRYTVDAPDVLVVKQVLRTAYNAAAEREGRPTMTEKAFGHALYKLRPNVIEKQRTVSGKLRWCYIGIGLVSSDGDSQHSRDSRDRPLSSPHE